MCMEVQAYNSSTWKSESGGPVIQGPLQLPYESDTVLEYVRPCLIHTSPQKSLNIES